MRLEGADRAALLGLGQSQPGGEAAATIPRVDPAFAQAKVLLIDDDPVSAGLASRALIEAGLKPPRVIHDPAQTLAAFEQAQPDLVLLDLLMPGMDGQDLIGMLQALSTEDGSVPIIAVTADNAVARRREVLRAGAFDFIAKPFDIVEMVLRVRNALKVRFQDVRLRSASEDLERVVERRTLELEEVQAELLSRLAQAAEFRAPGLGEHTFRVGRLAGAIAKALGLAPQVCRRIELAARLHDVGKVAVPDAILLKEGPLTPAEYAVVQTHAEIGASLMAGGRSELAHLAETIALSHHERWDGGGYPRGLAGEDIPIPGRITALADVLDVLTHERPYRKAVSLEAALQEVQAGAGTQFDPRIVRSLVLIPDLAGLLFG